MERERDRDRDRDRDREISDTVVCLLQTTQIKQGVSFIAANKVYTSANKTTVV